MADLIAKRRGDDDAAAVLLGAGARGAGGGVIAAGLARGAGGEATALTRGDPLDGGGRRGDAGVEDHAGRLEGAGGPLAVERVHEVAVVRAGLAHVGDVLAEQEAGELQRDRGPALVGEDGLGAGELAEEGDAEDRAVAAVGELDRELAEEVAADDAADVGGGAGGAEAPAPRELGGGGVARFEIIPDRGAVLYCLWRPDDLHEWAA